MRKLLSLPLIVAWGVLGLHGQSLGPGGTHMILDDFRSEVSLIGTAWEGFTDQVMGGRSEMSILRVPNPEGPYLSMRGKVSLERNGGFIQVRLKLSETGKPVDLSSYQGIRLTVRGEGKGYYIFLRTAQTLFPWKFYKAAIPVSTDWSTVDLPWSAFGPGDYGRVNPLKVEALKSLAITAYGEEFDARIDVKEVGLY